MARYYEHLCGSLFFCESIRNCSIMDIIGVRQQLAPEWTWMNHPFGWNIVSNCSTSSSNLRFRVCESPRVWVSSQHCMHGHCRRRRQTPFRPHMRFSFHIFTTFGGGRAQLRFSIVKLNGNYMVRTMCAHHRCTLSVLFLCTNMNILHLYIYVHIIHECTTALAHSRTCSVRAYRTGILL